MSTRATLTLLALCLLAPRPAAAADDDDLDAWAKQVATFKPDEQAKAVAAKLKELNRGFDGNVQHVAEVDALTSLSYLGNLVRDIRPLAALKGLKHLNCACSSDRSVVDEKRLTDLGPLKALPLESLDITHTDVESLAPLEGM